MPREIIGLDEADRIHEQLGKLVEFHLPEAVVAFTSGSLPFGAAVRGISDIDVNVVLPADTKPDDALFDRLRGFIDDYRNLHHQHGMRLDCRYPGEYFTVGQAHDAAAGRGIPVINGKPALPRELGDSYWDSSEDTWYLAWMGALAFSRHVAGNRDVLAALRRRAWATIVTLCLPDLRSRDFDAEDVMARILDKDHPNGGFGVHPGYRRFAELEAAHCRQALADLSTSGILARQEKDSFFVEDDELLSWATGLAARHRNGFHAASLLTVASSLRLAI
ncbi:hypothetical protein [Streptomyces alanosinicus]|uniref:Nucleotidyltransferase domain-containing protein n=1 Tax=Streptomyces alanosinicus TaxID=68171 RepID=A0A918YP84_9ACTN|nr:hypothetical protein [Streptomyces alanosinicus]GHE11360.1 hypothetical protein GCM10010339_70710 [Streptomyces alanosinicus]